MDIDIQGQTDEQLEQHVTDRLTAALDQHEARVAGVSARLEDINGPKGGVDKSCKVTVQIRGGGSIIVEETSEDMYSAVAQAADRVKNAVGREMERRKDRRPE